MKEYFRRKHNKSTGLKKSCNRVNMIMIDRSMNDMQEPLGPFSTGPDLLNGITERLLEPISLLW